MNFRTKPLAAMLTGLFAGALSLSGNAMAAAAAQDTGATSSAQTQTVSIVMQLRNVDQLNKFIADTANPNSPHYLQFLSVEQFAKRFGPSDADIASVVSSLNQAGIQVSEIYRSHLVIRATGTTDQLNQYFGTQVHNYQENGLSYQKPASPVKIPNEVSDIVLTVTGLDTKPKMHKMSRNLGVSKNSVNADAAQSAALVNNVSTTNAPGSFTVADFAQLYNVNPLYQMGLRGQGATIGIATLATFTPSDAYTYWQSVGLHVASDKIKQIHVDGGAGTDGADETTLDVEQSGGIAPAARVFVYDGPNTDEGFADIFFKAAEQNKVDTLSVSWGGPEIAQNPGLLSAQHEAFLELAAQGIPVFASAGDSGAYDINDQNYPYTYPGCSMLLSVDSPSSDPMVVAAGGLTLAHTEQHKYGVVTVPTDRPWAWDYLQNYMVSNYGEAFYYANYFPVGGGGGVSVNYDAPSWQVKQKGAQLSAPNQSLICQTTSGPQDLIDMPAGYAGRNLPDLSFNADPNTGYAEYFQGAWQSGWGGTSFVAPQLNGVFALVTQAAGTRLGYLNPQLYSIFRQVGYSPVSPFKAITSGDNEYWQATKSYNPASGLGSLDVTKLAFTFAFWDY